VVTGISLERDQKGQILDNPKNRSDIIDDPNYTKCDNDCMYGRASENVSLQIDYMQAKLAYLRNKKNSPEDKLALLGGYCYEGEDLDPCLKRYEERYHDLWLVKAKSALIHHEEAQKDLKCVNRDRQGNCQDPSLDPDNAQASARSISPSLRPNEKEKKAQNTYFLKANELAEYSKKLSAVEDKRNEKEWMDNYFDEKKGLKPSKEDFKKFKCSDPKDTTTCHLEVDANGKFIPDEEAYRLALEDWNGIKTKLEADLTGKGKSVQQKEKIAKEAFEKIFSGKPNGNIQRQLYNQVRGDYVDDVNGKIKDSLGPKLSGVTSETAFGGADNKGRSGKSRNTASADSADSKPKAKSVDPVELENKEILEQNPMSEKGSRTESVRSVIYRPESIDTVIDRKMKSGEGKGASQSIPKSPAPSSDALSNIPADAPQGAASVE